MDIKKILLTGSAVAAMAFVAACSDDSSSGPKNEEPASSATIDQPTSSDGTTPTSNGTVAGSSSSASEPVEHLSSSMDASVTNMVITEVMYNAPDASELEWVEVSIAAGPDLKSMAFYKLRLEGAITYSFPAEPLTKGEYIVVTNNVELFKETYPAFAGRLFGPWDNDPSTGTVAKLSNEGDVIDVKLTGNGDVSCSYSKEPPWPSLANGKGRTLVYKGGNAALPSSWGASKILKGNPGVGNDEWLTTSNVRINEIMPTLGGEKSNITAYFTDIASFSTFSEKIGDPSKLVDLLNEYLTAMTDTLLENQGTLDKYEGDAIIAFFGAPMPLPNHAQNACETAVDMQTKLMKLRRKWANEGDKWPKVVHDMHMRIGINSGDIVTGNMGSTMRKNYTMMGDAVNLAARLESAAKQYGAYIQISEDTQKHLEEGYFIYRSLDTIRVIGKSQPVKTFELLAKSGCENEKKLKELVDIWEKARACYLNMQWDDAIALFKQCLELEPHHPDRDPGSKTTPSHVYIKRCETYKITPPVAEGEVWDGVYTATEK